MSRRRPGIRYALLGGVVLLYILAIPWYRAAGERPGLVGGVPDWFLFALGCYALAAVLNALAWGLTEMEDPPPPGGDPR